MYHIADLGRLAIHVIDEDVWDSRRCMQHFFAGSVYVVFDEPYKTIHIVRNKFKPTLDGNSIRVLDKEPAPIATTALKERNSGRMPNICCWMDLLKHVAEIIMWRVISTTLFASEGIHRGVSNESSGLGGDYNLIYLC